MKKYTDIYTQSINNPDVFWKEQSNAISWYKQPTIIRSNNSIGYAQWFSDGELNMSYLCIDKHINDGYGEQVALIYDSPVTQVIQKITYNELKVQVAKLAGGLKKLGLEKGDRALIYMPMIPQAVFSMLACARLGIVHNVVFGGFASSELANRIDDCTPKVILTASSGIEVDKIIPYKPLVDAAIDNSKHKPNHVILYKRNLESEISDKGYDVDYKTLVEMADEADPVAVSSLHPLYIIHTSGTTGKPKGIIRDTGGYATALKFSMKYIYGVQPGEVFWASSDIGWVVGHSFIVYGPLIHRCTSILFEGKPVKTPDASTFWRIISTYNVVAMFTAPTAIRAIKKEDEEGEMVERYDISCLRAIFLGGERSDQATIKWLEDKLKCKVIDHWWQTESGWPMVANMVGVHEQENKSGSVSLPICGFDIQILDDEGNHLAADQEGMVVVKLPMPPGTMIGIWNDLDRFKSNYLEYFKEYYFTGDGGYKDQDGFVFITGRVDDVINVAGHRLSTTAIEEIIAVNNAVAECVVFGIFDKIKGEVPLALIVKKNRIELDDFTIAKSIMDSIRNQIGAFASLKSVLIVERLPKTRSGKILRKLLREMANNKAYTIPSTIDNVESIDEIMEVFRQFRIETIGT